MSNGREVLCIWMQADTAVTVPRTAACFIMLTIYIQQATIVKNSEIHALAKWKEHESRVNLALIRSKLILSYIYKILDGVHFI